ncbi:MAG TPA: ribonuclease H-like domain-containing protein [Planctomycetota bacterium]|nr:ribonuclease H-like domain-containing protein [Planctomycetota bacterium]
MSETREQFQARLQRTLRPAKPVEVAKAAAPLPDWFVRRMQRSPLPEASASPGHQRTRGLPERLVTETNARGSFGVRIERLGLDFEHGSARLDAVLSARGDALALLCGDVALRDFDPRRATFLDIETTGLSGGAGTQVFQVGLLELDADGFQLWQAFLRSPDEAPALLQACADRVRARGALVSFFGKSFDRHRLEDQMRLHGVAPPFAGRPHLDLYHPCRRLYGKAFADGRLATMERELCGVRRERDLPGAFAPAAWFDFLAGREHLLEAVFLHNKLDVLSLVGLCAHLADVLAPSRDTEPAGPSLVRARSLALWFSKQRDFGRALAWSERALREAETDPVALACQARALERTQRRSEARAAFALLASVAEDGLAAEALGEIARIDLGAGALDGARAACAQAATLGESALTGSRSARLARKLARVRSALAKDVAKPRR